MISINEIFTEIRKFICDKYLQFNQDEKIYIINIDEMYIKLYIHEYGKNYNMSIAIFNNDKCLYVDNTINANRFYIINKIISMFHSMLDYSDIMHRQNTDDIDCKAIKIFDKLYQYILQHHDQYSKEELLNILSDILLKYSKYNIKFKKICKNEFEIIFKHYVTNISSVLSNFTVDIDINKDDENIIITINFLPINEIGDFKSIIILPTYATERHKSLVTLKNQLDKIVDLAALCNLI